MTKLVYGTENFCLESTYFFFVEMALDRLCQFWSMSHLVSDNLQLPCLAKESLFCSEYFYFYFNFFFFIWGQGIELFINIQIRSFFRSVSSRIRIEYMEIMINSEKLRVWTLSHRVILQACHKLRAVIEAPKKSKHY